jgi:eukaryotic-like serine/threonine-protein kinase
MAAAHERGIIHRDIKPSNIFLVDWKLDDTRILDFGIARRVFDPKRFTKAGSTVGTPMYTAPEQARGDRDVDGRADVFSLGSVLFECLTGEPPFTGESPMEVMAKICIGAPPRLAPRCPGLPRQLEQLVESMLAQDRRQRPAETGQLAASFAAVAHELSDSEDTPAPVPATSPSRGTLSDAEQRVMCALLVRTGKVERQTPTRALPWMAETRVMPSAIATNDTREIAALVEPFGGHVDRLLDRSVLVTLPGRGLLREQAVQIARCALSLRTRLPEAVFGIATGRAALLAKLPVGPLVDRVQQMVDGQPSGAIRIDDNSARLLPTRFVVSGAGRERQLVEESDTEDRPREVAQRRGPFVGRDRELTTLLALYREATEEQVARAALVLAGSGAGKTRLRQELLLAIEAEAIDDGNKRPLVLRAGGELVRSQARYPLLGHILTAAGIDLEYSNSASSIQDTWVSWLRTRCADGPVLLILEDMQWSDLAGVQLVDTALRILKDQPLFVLALGRPEVDEQFPGLWAERSAERLRLPPLGRKAGQALLRHYLPGATEETENFILDRWEGNPFFLEELVETALLKIPVVPETILGLVEARFDELEPEVRRVLRAASVFGSDPFSPECVVAVLGEKSRRELTECLEILSARDILERCVSDGEDAYRFRARLTREAAYRMLPPGDRALARRLARAFLENAGKTLPEFLSVPMSQSAAIVASIS